MFESNPLVWPGGSAETRFRAYAAHAPRHKRAPPRPAVHTPLRRRPRSRRATAQKTEENARTLRTVRYFGTQAEEFAGTRDAIPHLTSFSGCAVPRGGAYFPERYNCDANKARRAKADFSAIVRDLNKARRVNADYSFTEPDANKARRANVGDLANVCDANKARRVNADYAAIERDAKKARRANADYAATERDPNKARRAHADYSATERDAKRAQRANAGYAAIKRDAKRARRVKILANERHCELCSRDLFIQLVIANGHDLNQEFIGFVYTNDGTGASASEGATRAISAVIKTYRQH